MAEITVVKRVCDVYGTQANVKQFAVILNELQPPERNDEDPTPVLELVRDLSPRALKRLIANIERSVKGDIGEGNEDAEAS